MKPRQWRNLGLALCMVLVAGMAVAETPAPTDAAGGELSPIYQSWAKAKVGAKTFYEQKTKMMGTETDTSIVYELVELTAEKAVVKMSTTSTVGGQKMEMPPQNMTFPARAPQATPMGTPPASAPAKATVVAEPVTVPGGTFKCTVVKAETEQGGNHVKSTMWSSEDVPGGLVKSETEISGGLQSTTAITLIRVELPK